VGANTARDEVAAYWDAVVAEWLDGRDPQPSRPELQRWFRAYAGSGRGSVTVNASPEPYIGPLCTTHSAPRLVALGLNPGEADLAFQGRNGVFAHEYAHLGGFSAWSVTEPYLRDAQCAPQSISREPEDVRATVA
jgi:hypothetical protein